MKLTISLLVMIVGYSFTIKSMEFTDQLVAEFSKECIHMQQLYKSERLYFRKFTHDDTYALQLILGDPAVMEYALSDETLKTVFHAMSKSEIQAFLDRVIISYSEHGWGRYAVVKENGDLIGYCGLKLQTFDDGSKCIELGYRFKKKEWNKGYATEAVKATLEYIRTDLPLKEVHSIVDKTNTKSINVLMKAGFSFLCEKMFYNVPANVYKLEFETHK